MNVTKMLGFATDRVLLDVSWFLLLCAIVALFRFHRRRKKQEPLKVRTPNESKKAA